MFLNQRASFLLGTVAALALAAASSDVRAQQINVSATVTATCTVGDADLDFGNYDSAPGAETETSTTLSVDCTAPADVGVTLGNGDHQNGSPARRMKHGTEDKFLTYHLWNGSPSSSPEWTVQEVLFEDVGPTGIEILIGGSIPGGQTGLPSGTYNDVVLVTLDVKS